MAAAVWHDERLTLPDGRVLAYRDSGDPTAPSLLYCHGFPGSRFEQEAALGAAAARGLRVLVPDRPGYGGSGPCSGRSVRGWADDVLELIRHRGVGRVRVLGFSGGGAYALACAAAHPQVVEQVALFAAMGPVSEPRFAQEVPEATRLFFDLARSEPAELRRQIGMQAPDGPTLFSFMLTGMCRADLQTMSAPVRQQSYERSLSVALDQGAEGIVEDAMALGSPWGFALDEVGRPVDVWHGAEDLRVSATTAVRLSNALEQGRLTCLPGTGHFPGEDVWAAVIDRLVAPVPYPGH